MVLEMLRNHLIDLALDQNDKELFLKLTAPGWEKIVVKDQSEKEEVNFS